MQGTLPSEYVKLEMSGDEKNTPVKSSRLFKEYLRCVKGGR